MGRTALHSARLFAGAQPTISRRPLLERRQDSSFLSKAPNGGIVAPELEIYFLLSNLDIGPMIRKVAIILLLGVALTGCAGAQATRTSQNTLLIDAGAAPACGGMGASKVAAKSAAIETIRAGFDRYIIAGGAAANNVQVSQLPGQYNSYGTATYGGGFGTFQSRTTYTPGPTVVSGSHDRSLSVVMFKPGDPGFESAIDAREALGPEWPELVKSGVHTCL